MIRVGKSLKPIIDIKNLGFDMGAHLLIKLGLTDIAVGEDLEVVGTSPHWQSQLGAWCRGQGHAVRLANTNGKEKAIVTRGHAETGRWHFADKGDEKLVCDRAESTWGLAARGATIEAGGPEFSFRLSKKIEVWADHAPKLYAQALAAQWDPEKAIDWSPTGYQQHSDLMETAIVQVFTYMIENENAALLVPARFLGQLHPHFREVQALLAIQVADEAKHIAVFTRRLHLYGKSPALSTAGGQASLKTLLDEPEFSIASFLLSVLGEGTFVDLLRFLHQYAPDPVAKSICLLASRDESRHVSFGMSHLRYQLERDSSLREALRSAVEARFEGLAKTSGLNAEVFDSLILIAAGDCTPEAIAIGYERIQILLSEMEIGRRSRLEKLGFTVSDATRLASLHTRNFM